MAGGTWLEQLNTWLQQQLYGAGQSGDPTFAPDPRYAAMAQLYAQGYRPPDANLAGATGGMPTWLQRQQEQRRYGGSPSYTARYPSAAIPPHPTMQNPSNYNQGATGWQFAEAQPAEGAWQQGMWDAMLAGQNPLANVPAANWEEALMLMQSTLPLMQQRYNQQQDAVGADQWNRQFAEAARQFDAGQGNWAQQFAAGRQDQGFQNWLAMQQLAQGAGSQSFNQDLQNRQLAEQIRQADMGQGNWLQQFQAGRDDALWGRGFQQQQLGEQQRQFDVGQGNWLQQFTAGRDDALWNRDFSNRQLGEQVRQFDVGQGNWLQQFQAGRDDAQWSRGFNERQFGANRADTAWNQNFQQQQADRSQSNWGAEMERNKALDAWSQAFQSAQFDWNKAQQETQNKQNEEAMYLSAFGRKFGPNVASM